MEHTDCRGANISRLAMEQLYPMLVLIAANMGLDPEKEETKVILDLPTPFREACRGLLEFDIKMSPV